MFVDIHTHVALRRHALMTRPRGTHYPTPESLKAMMDATGIVKAVIVCGKMKNTAVPFVTPEEILDIAYDDSDRFVPFCNVDPKFMPDGAKTDFRNLLKAYKELGCKGIGEYMSNLPFDDPLNMNFFQYLEESGLPLTFHIASMPWKFYGCIDEVGLPRLEKVLKTFPSLIFLGHSPPFWAEISRDVSTGNKGSHLKGPVMPGRVVELMRKYPNLHGDLSAGSGFGAIKKDPEFGFAFMEEFSERLYFGTDFADDTQETPIVQYFRMLKKKNILSEKTFENITWKNANRLLDLKLTD